MIITSGRQKTPVAKLESIDRQQTRPLGFLAHLRPDLPESFFDPLPEEELKLWEGDGEA